jgi:hypothetical protein
MSILAREHAIRGVGTDGHTDQHTHADQHTGTGDRHACSSTPAGRYAHPFTDPNTDVHARAYRAGAPA